MITYNTEKIEMPPIDQTMVTRWLSDVASSYAKKIGEINYIFVDDERILQINREFIQHDYYTDHIGFDYSEADILSGDIFISVDTVYTNAEKYGATYLQELHRVIVHGLLHQCGIDDKEPGEREIMEAAENAALAKLAEYTN